VKIEGISHATAVICDGQLLVFGGISEIEQTNDLIIINLTTFESKKIQHKPIWPQTIDSHSAVIDEKNKKMLIYGGLSKYKTTSDIWEYDITKEEWKKLEVKGKIPEGRSCHAAVLQDNSMFIYGGINEDDDSLGDLWEFNLTTNTWTKIEFTIGENNPDVRYGHSMVCKDSKIYIFGGTVGKSIERNEFWKFDIPTKTWEKIHGVHRPEDPLERETPNSAVRNRRNPSKGDMSNKNNLSKDFTGKSFIKKSTFGLIKSESMGKLHNKKQLGESMILTKHEELGKSPVREPMSPVSTSMSNSIVLRSFTKKSLKDFYKGPAQKEEGEIEAKVPCARDGHSAVFYNGRMIIFGGDRHKMSFSDLYYFSIN